MDGAIRVSSVPQMKKVVMEQLRLLFKGKKPRTIVNAIDGTYIAYYKNNEYVFQREAVLIANNILKKG